MKTLKDFMLDDLEDEDIEEEWLQYIESLEKEIEDESGE